MTIQSRRCSACGETFAAMVSLEEATARAKEFYDDVGEPIDQEDTLMWACDSCGEKIEAMIRARNRIVLH
jgi:DNA-directed RNA polymerase subunit RPC12/RpoP